MIPFVPRTTKDPDAFIRDAYDKVFPEELFAYPHDPWFAEKILERIRQDRFVE